MNKPKYSIGDRVSDSRYIVRGKMKLHNGNYRYFLQIEDTDNSVVMMEYELENY